MSLQQKLVATQASSLSNLRPIVESAARGDDYDAEHVVTLLNAAGLKPRHFDEAVRLAAELDDLRRRMDGVDIENLRERAGATRAAFHLAVEKYRKRGLRNVTRVSGCGHVVGVNLPALEAPFEAWRVAKHAHELAENLLSRAARVERDLATALGHQRKTRTAFRHFSRDNIRHRGDYDGGGRRVVRGPDGKTPVIEKVLPPAEHLDIDDGEGQVKRIFRARG